jgi:hypothetical protein
LLLLASGATLNVAVAWGCAMKSELLQLNYRFAKIDPEYDLPQLTSWASSLGFDWPKRNALGTEIVTGAVALGTGVVTRKFHPYPYALWGVSDLSAGLPMLSMTAHVIRRYGDAEWQIVGGKALRPAELQLEARLIPLRPLWPGFAINTLFYAGVLWMLFCGPFALRRMIRRRRGQCPACAYPIGWGAGQSPVCTECGAAVGPLDQNRARQEAAGIAANPTQHD